jgi:hypothetical protein
MNTKECFNPNCDKKAKEKCGGCAYARYCSKSCQTVDWKQHKADCKEMKEMKNNSLNLLKAVADDDFGQVQHYVECGADVNYRDKLGRNSLLIALFYGQNQSILQYLLRQGVDVNSSDIPVDMNIAEVLRTIK